MNFPTCFPMTNDIGGGKMKRRLLIYVGLIVLAIISFSVLTILAAEDCDTPSLTIVSNTLELENAVFMNFKVDAQGVKDADNIKLLVWEKVPDTYDKDSAETVLSPIRTEADTGRIVFQYDDLAAKDMTKFVYVCAYTEVNGLDIYSNAVKFSIVQYAYNTLSTGTAPEYLEGILTNMLEYGAFSQLYFNHNIDFLATDEIAKIKVVNGTHTDGFKTGYYKAGTSVTLIANKAEEGYVFSHWKDSSDKAVGTEETLVIDNCTTETYTAVYVEDYLKYSENLKFESNGDGTCRVGIGTCSDTDILIPPMSPDGDAVTAVGRFTSATITSVVIPDGVTMISDFAFSDCTNLVDISIPNSVIRIGSKVFNNCSKINYNEYDNAQYIGNEDNPYLVLVKAVNKNINSCNINEFTKVISHSAFLDCKSLRTVTIPNGLKNIENCAFENCNTLSTVTIPASVTRIGSYAFDNTYISNAIFDNPNGWWYASTNNATSGTSISSYALSDPADAAKYLRKNYYSYTWFRD